MVEPFDKPALGGRAPRRTLGNTGHSLIASAAPKLLKSTTASSLSDGSPVSSARVSFFLFFKERTRTTITGGSSSSVLPTTNEQVHAVLGSPHAAPGYYFQFSKRRVQVASSGGIQLNTTAERKAVVSKGQASAVRSPMSFSMWTVLVL